MDKREAIATLLEDSGESEARRHEALSMAMMNAKGVPINSLIHDARLIEEYLKGGSPVPEQGDTQSMN